MSAGGGTPASVPARPLLSGLYHVVPLGPDRVVIANAGRKITLSAPGFTERVGPFLAALDGASTADELCERFPNVAPPVLAGLAAKGLLDDAAPVPDGPAGAPQSCALALPGAPSPAGTAARLTATTVAVFGCGPTGGAVAVLLAKAGVGRLMLTDDGCTDDDVAVSPVLQPTDDGLPRAGAVAGQCRDLTSAHVEVHVDVDVVADSLPHDPPDLAVVELGYDGTPTTVADRLLGAGVPYLVHSQDALEAAVGPLVEPGGEPCHRCLAARRLGHVSHLDEHLAYLDHRATARPRPDAFLAAQVSVVAGLVATEALRALLEADPRTRGAVLTVDLGGPVLRREVLLPLPGCPSCAAAAAGLPMDAVAGSDL